MLPQFDVHLVRNTLRHAHRSDTTRLCARNQAAGPNVHAPLRDLRVGRKRKKNEE
jgi:hypothetical protein